MKFWGELSDNSISSTLITILFFRYYWMGSCISSVLYMSSVFMSWNLSLCYAISLLMKHVIMLCNLIFCFPTVISQFTYYWLKLFHTSSFLYFLTQFSKHPNYYQVEFLIKVVRGFHVFAIISVKVDYLLFHDVWLCETASSIWLFLCFKLEMSAFPSVELLYCHSKLMFCYFILINHVFTHLKCPVGEVWIIVAICITGGMQLALKTCFALSWDYGMGISCKG